MAAPGLPDSAPTEHRIFPQRVRFWRTTTKGGQIWSMLRLMKVDLDELQRMHPRLPKSTVAEYAHRAALGLGRHQHQPGVGMPSALDNRLHETTVHWSPSESSDAEQLDRHRVTEDAAEAIALALVHVARGWVVRRRLQRGEFADWLLEDSHSTLVALEISGTDEADGTRRLLEKMEQVRKSNVANSRAACVVVLAVPRTTLKTV